MSPNATRPTANPLDIRRALDLLTVPGGVVEIRALEIQGGGRPYTASGYFMDPDSAVRAATELDARRPAGVYLVLNEINPALFARSANRITNYPKAATADADIIHRRWLPLDFDSDRPKGVSASEEEHAAAVDAAHACAAWLTSLGWPAPIVADSGNGAHVLHRIDLPNNQVSTALVRTVIAAIADKWDSPKVKIDRTVFNAARIWKFYGTSARKGDSIPDRPHRVARLLDVPEHVDVVSAELLQAVAVTTEQPAPLPSMNGNAQYESRLDVARWLSDRARAFRIKDRAGSDGRVIYLLDNCPFDAAHGERGETAIFQAPDGKLGAECKHNSCTGKGWQEFKKAIGTPDANHYDPPLSSTDAEAVAHGKAVADAIMKAAAPPPVAQGPEQTLHVVAVPTDDDQRDDSPADDTLYDMPGFVGELAQHIRDVSPYPNVPLSFAFALGCQAHLAARKVRDEQNLRTNPYILALATTGVGKNEPRMVAQRLFVQIGMGQTVADRFASAAGVEDALVDSPALFAITDEFDTVLKSAIQSTDGAGALIFNILLKLYSNAGDVYPLRKKAYDGPKTNQPPRPTSIDQPSLTGAFTCTPSAFYSLASERLLTSGLVPRLLIVEAQKRGYGQDVVAEPIPEHLVSTGEWWRDYNPTGGDLYHEHPNPRIVSADKPAQDVLRKHRRQYDDKYNGAQEQGDDARCAVYARVHEHVRRLSLIFACSENHEQPTITTAGVEWAIRFVEKCSARMLAMIESHAAENPFDLDCKKLLEKLRKTLDRTLTRTILLRRMKRDAKEFDKIANYLIETRQVRVDGVDAKTLKPLAYTLCST